MPRATRTPWLGQEPNQYVWYIYWFENARRVRRRSTGTSDRSEAEKALGQFIVDHAQAETAGPVEKPEKYLVATALRWYLQERVEELASAAFAARAAERLVEFFGPRATVSTITPQVLKRYERERVRTVRIYNTKKGEKIVADKRPVTSAMIRREFVVLSAALNHAIKNGRLTTAPKIIMPPAPPHRTRYLERDEIERLLEHCIEPHIRLFVTLAINTGARKGALLGLTWQQVDFANRIIYLNPEGRAQTNKRRAIVPMNDLLYEILSNTKARSKAEADEAGQKMGQSVEPSNYVIAFRNTPVVNIRTGFMLACQRAGIKGVTPHTLRHTAGTLMALAGIDLFLIAKVLGHSVQKTTEMYAHFQPSYLRGAVDVLAKATGVGHMPKIDATQSAVLH